MLTYNIPTKREKPLYEYLYDFIKQDILSSKLKAGEKLPSKRNLAKQMQISLITVENAYNQLIAEGYIYAIEKRGYFIEDISPYLAKTAKAIKEEKEENEGSESFTLFPYSTWSSLSRKVLSQEKRLSPSPFKGDFNLRKAIAKHLHDFLNLDVSPSCIVLGAGSEYLYSLLIQYFSKDKIYALENPGHLSISKIYDSNKTQFRYIPLDEAGISIKELYASNASIAHISPAHHFPTGITMPLKRRMELLKWARNTNGYIIEDDYDSEFRFSSRPIPPLYQLDGSNRVIYMNTFTKTMSSSFRIAYLVLPETLAEDFEEKLGFYHNTLSTLEQKTLEKFISGGYLERHINRTRKYYRNVHDLLIRGFAPFLKEYRLELIEADSGLHFLLKHHFKVSDDKVEEILIKKNLHSHTLSHYTYNPKDSYTIVISYSNIELKEVDSFINSLKEVFRELLTLL